MQLFLLLELAPEFWLLKLRLPLSIVARLVSLRLFTPPLLSREAVSLTDDSELSLLPRRLLSMLLLLELVYEVWLLKLFLVLSIVVRFVSSRLFFPSLLSREAVSVSSLGLLDLDFMPIDIIAAALKLVFRSLFGCEGFASR